MVDGARAIAATMGPVEPIKTPTTTKARTITEIPIVRAMAAATIIIPTMTAAITTATVTAVSTIMMEMAIRSIARRPERFD